MDGVSKGKRELIIEAAEKIFSQKGFFQAKVEEIAAAAGVGKGTVYEYFSSKEEVFMEMIKEITKDIDLDYLNSSHFPSSTEKIREIMKEHLNFMLKHQNMARVMMQEHITMTDQILQHMKKTREDKLKSLENIIVEGVGNGEFRQDINSTVTAHLIFGATISLSGDIIEGDNALSVQELTDRAIDMMLYGIAAARA